MKKKFFATLVATMLVVGSVASAASRNHSDWFDLDRINAIDVEEDLTDRATRLEVALLVAGFADEMELLPSKSLLDFEDERDFSREEYKMVTRLSSTGIVCGYPDGEYRPDNDITRAEALTIILRAIDYFSLETESYRRGSSFTDTENHWASTYCERAYELGLVSGRGDGRFYPDDDITREEVITILVNLLGESNNPLIAAVDDLYDLEFENGYKDYDDNDRYNNRYDYDDDDDRYDYEDRTERPVVDTGSPSTSTKPSNGSSSERPERPVVDLTSNGDTPSISDGSRPERPVVDLTTDNSTPSTSRPSVDVDDDTASTRPARPTV